MDPFVRDKDGAFVEVAQVFRTRVNAGVPKLLGLPFRGDVTYISWTFESAGGEPMVDDDFVDTVQFYTGPENRPLFKRPRKGSYFSQIQAWQSFGETTPGTYVYSFALCPCDTRQHSGSLDFGLLDGFVIELRTRATTPSARIVTVRAQTRCRSAPVSSDDDQPRRKRPRIPVAAEADSPLKLTSVESDDESSSSGTESFVPFKLWYDDTSECFPEATTIAAAWKGLVARRKFQRALCDHYAPGGKGAMEALARLECHAATQ